MLKSNCKKVKEALRKYIVDGYDGSGFDEGTPEAEAKTFEEMARVILLDVKRVYGNEVWRNPHFTWQDAFVKWCSDLQDLVDTDYCCHGTAVKILGDMLEETEEERSRFTESEAETMLSRLLYRELSSVAFNVLH